MALRSSSVGADNVRVSRSSACPTTPCSMHMASSCSKTMSISSGTSASASQRTPLVIAAFVLRDVKARHSTDVFRGVWTACYACAGLDAQTTLLHVQNFDLGSCAADTQMWQNATGRHLAIQLRYLVMPGTHRRTRAVVLHCVETGRPLSSCGHAMLSMDYACGRQIG